MKTIHDFIYCDGIITTQTVFYLVKVGTSRADRYALQYVAKAARSPDFFFKVHSTSTMEFIEKCASSIYTTVDVHRAVALLRRQVVEVTWLASFLRKNPPELLNSLKISPAENRLRVNP